MSTERTERPWSENALRCSACPQDGRDDGSRGCPEWVGRDRLVTIVRPLQTREELYEGCGRYAMVDIIRSLTRASDAQAAASDSSRNATVGVLEQLRGEIPAIIALELERSGPRMMLAGMRELAARRFETIATPSKLPIASTLELPGKPD